MLGGVKERRVEVGQLIRLEREEEEESDVGRGRRRWYGQVEVLRA
jgi:hypothetical protein